MKKAKIYVTLKPSLLDAQGRVVQQALTNIGFEGVENVRIGKYIEMELANGATGEDINDMCAKLLANPVIEDFRFDIEEKEL
ncbi:MAG: phosphoribosylformylglycinamidine synthase subunit PurS [Armatimonadota bacterium]